VGYSTKPFFINFYSVLKMHKIYKGGAAAATRPLPFRGWRRGGNSTEETQQPGHAQGLDQRSKIEVVPKMARRKGAASLWWWWSSSTERWIEMAEQIPGGSTI